MFKEVKDLVIKGEIEKWPAESLTVNNNVGNRIALQRDSIELRLVDQIAVLSGVFVALAPPLFLSQIKGIENCGWRTGLVVGSFIGWGLMVIPLCLGIVYHIVYREAVFNNPHYYYGFLFPDVEKETVHRITNDDGGVRIVVDNDDDIYDKHRTMAGWSRRISRGEYWVFFAGIIAIFVTLVMLAIVVLGGW